MVTTGGGGGTASCTLQLRLVNVGRMAAPTSDQLLKRISDAENSNVTTGHIVSGVTLAAPLKGRIRHRSKAERLNDVQDSESGAAAAAAVTEVAADSEEEQKQMRLRRLKAISAAREKENIGNTNTIQVQQIEQFQVR
eukprot:SAG31_NODE_2697_length_5227_cov_1.318643_3_plen_138_part_00